MWMRNERLQRSVNGSRLLRRLLVGSANRMQMMLLAGHKSPEVLERIRHSRRGVECLLSCDEAFVLQSLARAQVGLGGDFAEVGVFEGASARLLAEVKGHNTLHLFDTFAGLPAPGQGERAVFREGQFGARLEAVRARLAGYGGIRFHQGMFPETAQPLAQRLFSFVHLDVDLESSTLAALDFFYDRMVAGGIIVTHDFSTIPGVARAFERFLGDRAETLIELPTTQAFLIKQGAPALAAAA
jgi:O-methyltransferase